MQSNQISGGAEAYGYIYDAEGRRVAKGTITASANPLTQPLSCNPASNGFTLTESYVLGEDGEQLTTLDQNQHWVRTNVYGGGQLLATYDAQELHFQLTDPLVTRRVQTSATGVAEENCQGLPFGDGLNCFTATNPPPNRRRLSPAALHRQTTRRRIRQRLLRGQILHLLHRRHGPVSVSGLVGGAGAGSVGRAGQSADAEPVYLRGQQSSRRRRCRRSL